MSAPTLPTRAERDPLRKVAGYAIKDGSTILLDEPGAVLLRLLDWADAHEQAAEHPSLARHVETLRELAAVHDEPRYVTCGDAVAIRAVLAALGGAVLAGGQAPERVVVGYRVRWKEPSGEQSDAWHTPYDGTIGDCRENAYEKAVLEIRCGSQNVRIRKLTRPVRQPDDGGAK